MNKNIALSPDVSTIVWDLDGTLLDSFGIYQDCLSEVLRKHGLKRADEEILRNNYHGSMQETVENVLRDTGQTVNETLLATLLSDFYALDNKYIEDVDHHLFEDAVDLAQRAKQMQMRQVVVTNRAHGLDRGTGSPRTMIAHSRLSAFIDTVICGDDSEYRKPHREVLEARFGEDLSMLGNILVIGDQFVDATFARNIGCAAILVQRTDQEIAHLNKEDVAHISIVQSLRDVTVGSRRP